MKTHNDWFYRFFNSADYLDIYRDMTGPKRTQQELRFCERVLDWSNNDLILDAPCGAGRHAINLARRGYHLVGLDISNFLLDLARHDTETLPLNIPTPMLTRGLMQAIPFMNNSFDYVICLFSSFGYGKNEAENLAIMEEFARVAKPGGKILIDVMNRHFILPRLNRVYDSVQSGLKVREERTVTDNQRRLHNIITVRDKNGNKRQYLYNPWLYNGFELSWLAARAGLNVCEIYGNFYAEKYDPKSERAILLAQKQ